MDQALTNNELDQLLDFAGYGRLDADIWFLGLQETGEFDKNLRSRLNFQQVEDVEEARNTLGLSLKEFCENNLGNSWRGMCEIMLRLDGKEASPANILEYQAERLGRANGSSLLCHLRPFPGVDDASGYETLLPQNTSRAAFWTEAKPLRHEFFRRLIAENLPRIIIGYGQSAWPEYQELFRDFKLTPNGQFMLGWDANVVVILCDDLSSEAMKGKFDELVALILENSLSIDTSKPTGPAPLSKAELARQKKDAIRQAAAARRKPSAKHNPSDPYCVCAYCLGYESEE